MGSVSYFVNIWLILAMGTCVLLCFLYNRNKPKQEVLIMKIMYTYIYCNYDSFRIREQ